MVRLVTSSSAAARLNAAVRFVLESPPGEQVLIVSASRGAADDCARDIARQRGATFGLHRFSLTQFAARLGSLTLAQAHLSPATTLGLEAVSARALFDARQDAGLTYFAPVASTPGFPGALARTLEELALGGVPAEALASVPGSGADLADLSARFDDQLRKASAADRAAFFRAATAGVLSDACAFRGATLLLLDAVVASRVETAFVSAVLARMRDTLVTIPRGDSVTTTALASHGQIADLDQGDVGGLGRLTRYLFADSPPPAADPLEEVELFSAPGEGREAVEIVRRVLREAAEGTPFDQMAIAVRAPRQYAGLLEHALRRAGVPAYFDRGTRRPHPAGRAFLAVLACAVENMSARRFAEYLSLGQVPALEDEAAARRRARPSSGDEVFGVLGERAEPPLDSDAGAAGDAGSADEGRTPRSPWKWERLLVDSRVIATERRWTRRLNGLVQECELQRRELQRVEPDAPRVEQLGRKIADLTALAAFALPLVRTMEQWPDEATWGEWLRHFEELAPRVLRRPDRVLRVLADLRPMSGVGPVTLDEASRVLAERLATIEMDPPSHRYGRVFVSGTSGLRGRSFDVVFVPGLAERMFPQKPREDPLLLDAARGQLEHRLACQPDRAEEEKLHLRLAAGAATRRLYVSFPTLELGEGRPRVPSLYALEVWRAMTGRVPGGDELQRAAAQTSRATLAWPAPAVRAEAIDALEHDLAALRDLDEEPDDRARGRARYILQLNDCLQRSVRERYMRGLKTWSHWDGLVRVTDQTAAALAQHRLTARTYSASGLQKYAVCPYQFLLSSIYRLRPAEDAEPLQRLDPLTKGSLFHAIQASFYQQLKKNGALPITGANRDTALVTLEHAVAEVADTYHELLVPAVERVWHDEIAAIRRDLRLWIDDMIEAGAEWVPLWFEWSFGLSDAGRDPESTPNRALIDGRFPMRGSIDLVERRTATGELRVTDHKTGKYRGKEGMVVDGGRVLQPVLYGIALEEATGTAVTEGRLYYATSAGGFQDVTIPLTPSARRAGVEVLEVIDRAVESGWLAQAPAEKACQWCDFLPVCGSRAEIRANHKARDPLADLLELRKRP